MALNRAEEERLVAHIATLFDVEGLQTLAKELRLTLPPGASSEESPEAMARFLVKRAEQASLTKSLLKSVLRRFPEDSTLRAALKRDPRFTKATSPGEATAPIAAALNLRAALQAWNPTHVLSLEPRLTPFATLVAGHTATLISNELDLAEAARGLGHDARLLLIQGDGSEERAQSILMEAQGRGFPVRVVTGMVI